MENIIIENTQTNKELSCIYEEPRALLQIRVLKHLKWKIQLHV